MPLYEYQCLSCGEISETLQRMSDDPLTECRSCQGELKRLVSAPAVQFKGTGWYVTDYAGKKGGEGKGSESKSDTGSDSGSKSESKDSGSKSSEKSSSDKGSASKTSTGDKKSA